MTIVRVAFDVPLPQLFDYRAEGFAQATPGRLVLAPFGRKIAVGVIVETASTSELPAGRLRRLLAVREEVPALPPDVLSLLKFCSEYYHHPVGEVVINALPTRLRRRQALKAEPHHVAATAAGRAAIDALPARARVLRELMLRLLGAGQHGVTVDALRGNPGAMRAARVLLKRGWAEAVAEADGPMAAATIAPGPALTAEQQAAVDAIGQSMGRFHGWLLHGITGSGKTEVYLELIAAALAAGRQSLLLVPEINLTPQLEARLRARFPATGIVRLHSGLNESERLRCWLAAQSGRAGIVLGTRSAVFTPMPRLSLVVVDEEHDPSYKQAEGLRYSARDLALYRGKQRNVPVILGSATPSLESYHQGKAGRHGMLALTNRPGAELPRIETNNIRGEALIDGLSQATLKAIEATRRRGEQSLVYINRRGYAPVLICPACGWSAGCPRCSAKLVVHQKALQLQCHHCGHRERIPKACGSCGAPELVPLGQGTQRVEAALARILPAARVLRIDRDSTRGRDAWPEMRRQIEQRAVDVLVGTQMLAKGHDFPALTLVCVINADASLYSTDFRAGERLFANLMQVAGRAGRAELAGQVLVQTEFPAHPLYTALRSHDYAAFAEATLAERRQALLPPFAYQAILRAEAPQLDAAMAFLQNAAAALGGAGDAVTVYDPVPAGLTRLAGRERGQLTLQAHSRGALQSCLNDWIPGLPALAARKVRWTIDVDPQEP